MLFLVGGDGTQFAGNLLYQAARKRQLPVSIVGIPKSIDNDSLMQRAEGVWAIDHWKTGTRPCYENG